MFLDLYLVLRVCFVILRLFVGVIFNHYETANYNFCWRQNVYNNSFSIKFDHNYGSIEHLVL